MEKKVWCKSNWSSNGILYPEEFFINQEDWEYFSNLPDDTVMVIFENYEGMPQYQHVYKKSDINEITVMGKKTIKGTDKIEEARRKEDGTYEHHKEKQVDNRLIEDASKALNIPVEQLSYDEVRPNIIIHNGNPILSHYGWNPEHTQGMMYFEEKKGNAYEERVIARINDEYSHSGELYKIGDFVVSKFNDMYTLRGSYDSKEEELEEFDKLLEYLEYKEESAPYWAFNKEKTKFSLGFSTKYQNNKEIINKIGKRDEDGRIDVAHEIIEMARNGSLCAKSIVERNTLIQEKDELENLMTKNQEKHLISEVEDTILDRKTNDINKVVAETAKGMQEISKDNERE